MKNILNRTLHRFNIISDKICGKLDSRSTEVLIDEDLEKHLKNNEKTILYVGIRYDYGNRNWGLSYEHYNFYLALLNMDYSLIYFDYDRIKQKYGIKKMSQMLREAVYYYHPNILFYFNYYDWIDHDIWRELSDEMTTKTIVWLADDHYRYEETRPIWELFYLVVTTDKEGYDKRRKEGFSNVLLSQWACNHFFYKNLNLPKIYDVSFIGRCYGKRLSFIETLRKEEVDVATFGQGWENDRRILQSDLIKIYNQSKISLNISFAKLDNNIQIKGRDFEAPWCGSLLVTKHSREIAKYLMPEKEIATYQDANDAVEKIKYYLKNEDERKRVAKKGYERVLKEHTFEKRFLKMFEFAQTIGR
jgi:spore maturation protein CgeB